MSRDSHPDDDLPEELSTVPRPMLGTLNGCGVTLYGDRDLDPETQSYVKTQCVVLLFLPVLCLRSFRVADARDGGWYFLRAVPLSGLGRLWNVLTCCAVVAGCILLALSLRRNANEGQVAQLQEARQRAADDDWVNAASLYDEIARGDGPHARQARDEFQNLLDQELPTASIADAGRAVSIAVRLARRGNQDFASHLIEAQVQPLVHRIGEHDPAAARRLVASIKPIVDLSRDPGAVRKWVQETQRKLIEAQYAATENPDLDLIVDLALVLERAGEPDRCETLLTARREELGTTEGARILGQIFARRGEHDEAITLLTPYLNEHLEALRVANERLAAQFKMAHQEALNEINRRQASAQFYAKYMQADRANDPARKNDLVQEYIGQRMRENEEITRLQAKVASLRAVVPATMDLGIVQLRRAQELSGEARAQELKNAETSFLAVRGQAGDSPLFKLFLGQVYYWMGRDEDGQKLFDELLGPERKPQTLLQVASVMRDLGRDEPARALSEEAFRTATDPEVKHGAAMTRALLRFDAEDEINWLEKADSGYPQVKISLNWARGNQALQQGRRNEAVRFIRASLDGYNGMAESPAMLNNSAMACFTLANITGDLAEFDRGIARLEKAISLNANDATLQKNAARYLLEKAARELIGRTADLSQLQLNINLSTLECFYNDEAGFQAIVAEHGEQAATARAIVFLKKLTVISPKRPDSWKQLAALYLNHRDAPAMKSLLERLQQNNVEVATPLKKWRDYRSGREDTRIRKMAGQSLERNGLARTKHAEARNDTWMLASCSIVASRLSLFTIGDPIDIDGTIAMAEDVLRTNPNNMLRKSHFSLVLHRALRDLARSVPEIEDLHRRFQRDIPPLQLLVIALRRADGHRETIRTHPDVQRAIESIQGDLKLFPKAARAGIVMLFRQLGDDEQADERLQCLKQREDVRLWQRVNAELHPYLPVAVIDAAWHHQLLGEDDQARALLERCSSFGVELPPLE